jgi:glycine dehydrogenase
MNAPFKPANEAAATFARRHIGPSPRDVAAMLETVGAPSLEALMSETLPASIRQKAPLDLGTPLSETEALAHMRELASQNRIFTSLIGTGYSGTILPAVIQRNILENPAWYTAYTPYQPEISQGRLEALFNFQTMVCDLTGLDVANASLLDERWRWPSVRRRPRQSRSSSMRRCIRRRSPCCAPAPSRWAGI